jgi:hypothetical protein
MWSTGYPSYAVVRRLTARPGQNCGLDTPDLKDAKALLDEL